MASTSCHSFPFESALPPWTLVGFLESVPHTRSMNAISMATAVTDLTIGPVTQSGSLIGALPYAWIIHARPRNEASENSAARVRCVIEKAPNSKNRSQQTIV